MEYADGRSIGELLKERNIILKGADVLTVKAFTMVRNFLLETDHLSPGAKLTHAMLLKYARHKDCCFPGQDRVAKELGVTRQSVNSYIQELSRQKYIKITRLGQGRTNLYQLNLSGTGKVRGTR